MAPFDPIHSLYTALLSTYGPQGWWPIRGVYTKQNNHYRTLSEEERFEICLGADWQLNRNYMSSQTIQN